MEWNMIFPYSKLAIFHFIPKIFHFILKFSSIFNSILPYQKSFLIGSNAGYILHLCNVVSTREGARNNTKFNNRYPVTHSAHGLMHRCSQDFGLSGGQTANHMQWRHQKFSKRETFYGTKNKRSQVGGLVWPATIILLKEKD